MLSRYARTVRRARCHAAYAPSTLRQLRNFNTKLEGHSPSADQGLQEPLDSLPDDQPSQQTAPVARNIELEQPQRSFPATYRPTLASLDPSLRDHKLPIENASLLYKRPVLSNATLEKLEFHRKESNGQYAAPEKTSTSSRDYEAMETPLRGQWSIPQDQLGGEPRRPWLRLIENSDGDGMQRLNAEIKAVEKYLTLTPAEQRAAESTTALINTIATKYAPEYKLVFHGSRCTGLASPYSDIDASFNLPEFEKEPETRGPSPTRPEAKKTAEKLLFRICHVLRQMPFRLQDIEMVRSKIPLVSAFDVTSRVKFQCMGMTPVQSSLEFTNYYLSEYPNLRPLFVVFRQALEMRRLNVVKDGGLGSYPLLIMILTALNHDTGHIPKGDLASQLLHVLEFWSSADLYKTGYSADPPRLFSKTAKPATVESDDSVVDPYLRGIDVMRKHRPDRPFLLCLQDPGNPTNDLGKKAFLVKHIQELCRIAHIRITKRMKEWEILQDVGERRGWGKSLLDSLLNGAYGQLEEQRRCLEERFPGPTPECPNEKPAVPIRSIAIDRKADNFRISRRFHIKYIPNKE